jgi:hypothetical protein
LGKGLKIPTKCKKCGEEMEWVSESHFEGPIHWMIEYLYCERCGIRIPVVPR